MMKQYQIMFNTKDGAINEAFFQKLDNSAELNKEFALTAIQRQFGLHQEEIEGISYYPLEPVVLM